MPFVSEKIEKSITISSLRFDLFCYFTSIFNFQSMEVHPLCHDQASFSHNSNTSGTNVFVLLAQREISPRAKHVRKWHWGESSKSKSGSSNSKTVLDAKCGLLSWVEAESLRNLSAKYCPLLPAPRSTIAAAFSLDGKMIASTHGDHTVKIIDCESGNCLKVFSGHRRTPWVVRFHPMQRQILASGSLDQEVRLWDASTSELILSHSFSYWIYSLRSPHCISCFPCQWGNNCCCIRPQVVHVALPKWTGITSDCVEDKAVATGCAFSPAWRTVSFNCSGQ